MTFLWRCLPVFVGVEQEKTSSSFESCNLLSLCFPGVQVVNMGLASKQQGCGHPLPDRLIPFPSIQIGPNFHTLYLAWGDVVFCGGREEGIPNPHSASCLQLVLVIPSSLVMLREVESRR